MPVPSSTPVVWITGAAGGLGRALVDAFSAAGCRVMASYHSQNSFEETECLWATRLDVTQSDAVKRTRDALRDRWGRIDVLINNAGVTQNSLLAGMTEEAWDRILAVNLRGAFLCSREAASLMIGQRSGHIVNISSFAARKGHAGQANYTAAKAGLIGLTQSLAQELGSSSVCVNVVMPGVMPTPMTQPLTGQQRDALIHANALRRLNDPVEVARFVQFLTTMQNVSGQVFQLDSRLSRWT